MTTMKKLLAKFLLTDSEFAAYEKLEQRGTEYEYSRSGKAKISEDFVRNQDKMRLYQESAKSLVEG